MNPYNKTTMRSAAARSRGEKDAMALRHGEEGDQSS